MTTNIGTLFPVTIATSSDAADIEAAFKYYHWGQTSELSGTSMTTSGGGVTGALYRLTNNPKFYGNSASPYLTVYSGTTLVAGTTIFSLTGTTNTLSGSLTLTAGGDTGKVTAPGGFQGKILASNGSTVLDNGTTGLNGVFNGNVTGNLQSTSTTTGQSTFSNTSGTTFTPVGKIFVQVGTPVSPNNGDLWFW